MKRLSVATRIHCINGLSLALSLAGIFFLLDQIGRVSTHYDEVISTQVRQLDKARTMQVDLKKQVQEWKDMLLRGDDPRDREKYRDGFFQHETVVQQDAQELRKETTDSRVLAALDEFVAAHEKLGKGYRSALAVYVQPNGATDAKAADKLVRGQDRAPTDMIDRIVEDVGRQVEEVRAAQSAAVHGQRWIIGLASSIVVLIVFGLSALIGRSITRPLVQTVRLLETVAGGDLTRRFLVESRDEVGRMGEALNEALDRMNNAIHSIGRNSETLAGSSEELSVVSTQMSANAQETATQAGVVSAASKQVSQNVQTVAVGVEEMSASIREIAKNASEAARVATSAVRVAEATNATVGRLGASSAEIGQVIKVITSIAQQTNLLALNATIEAARAGEAGKGFAVVANEVKDLAKETARATEDIGRKIEAIRSDTNGAVEAITHIGGIITQINDISNTIAAAVEQQTATTNEMSRNVSEAAKGSAEIAQNITAVAQAAQSTTEGACNSQAAAGELARMAVDLQHLVNQFRYKDRDANARDAVPVRGEAYPDLARTPLPRNGLALSGDRRPSHAGNGNGR